MSRSRGSEVPQRQSPRGPHQLRTSSVKNQPIAQRSSAKIGDRRTPQSNSSVNEKKFGTRVAELESQLGQAQNELKILKQQISETAKKEDNQPQTDVFQVSVEKVKIECVEVDKETKTVNEEIKALKAKLGDKEKEVEVVVRANENLKKRLEEAAISISNSKAKEDEMMLKLSAVEEELEASKSISAKLKGKLDSVQGEKEALEAEMKLLRVQTEQWRKQADVAAAILSGGNGRIPERCGGVFEATGYMASPGLGDDLDDGFGNGKRKGSGIKMFGELWKKKGQN